MRGWVFAPKTVALIVSLVSLVPQARAVTGRPLAVG
jgi:hypothetical protein